MKFRSYGISSERLGGLSRSRSALRDRRGRFLPVYGYFRFQDVADRFLFACTGYMQIAFKI